MEIAGSFALCRVKIGLLEVNTMSEAEQVFGTFDVCAFGVRTFGLGDLWLMTLSSKTFCTLVSSYFFFFFFSFMQQQERNIFNISSMARFLLSSPFAAEMFSGSQHDLHAGDHCLLCAHESDHVRGAMRRVWCGGQVPTNQCLVVSSKNQYQQLQRVSTDIIQFPTLQTADQCLHYQHAGHINIGGHISYLP